MRYRHTLSPDGLLAYSLEGDLLGLNEEQELLEVARTARQQGARHCAVDLSGVYYVNSTGLSLLIRLLRMFQDDGGCAAIVAPARQVAKLLVITKLDTIFKIADTLPQIQAHLQCLPAPPKREN